MVVGHTSFDLEELFFGDLFFGDLFDVVGCRTGQQESQEQSSTERGDGDFCHFYFSCVCWFFISWGEIFVGFGFLGLVLGAFEGLEAFEGLDAFFEGFDASVFDGEVFELEEQFDVVGVGFWGSDLSGDLLECPVGRYLATLGAFEGVEVIGDHFADVGVAFVAFPVEEGFVFSFVCGDEFAGVVGCGGDSS